MVYNYQSQERSLGVILLANLYTLFNFWLFSHFRHFSGPGFHSVFSPPRPSPVWDSFSLFLCLSWPRCFWRALVVILQIVPKFGFVFSFPVMRPRFYILGSRDDPVSSSVYHVRRPISCYWWFTFDCFVKMVSAWLLHCKIMPFLVVINEFHMDRYLGTLWISCFIAY